MFRMFIVVHIGMQNMFSPFWASDSKYKSLHFISCMRMRDLKNTKKALAMQLAQYVLSNYKNLHFFLDYLLHSDKIRHVSKYKSKINAKRSVENKLD